MEEKLMEENRKSLIDKLQGMDVKLLIESLLRQAIRDTYETEFSRYDMKKNERLLKELYKKYFL